MNTRRMHALSALAAGLALAALASTAIAADDATQRALGKKLFMEIAVPACALCHALKDAGAASAVGPVLDEIKPDAARVTKALRDGLGQMPSYKGRLTEEQIAALASYVSKASSGAP